MVQVVLAAVVRRARGHRRAAQRHAEEDRHPGCRHRHAADSQVGLRLAACGNERGRRSDAAPDCKAIFWLKFGFRVVRLLRAHELLFMFDWVVLWRTIG
eukprot:6183933-Pleurochrysis_carterae.AAC.1